MEICEPKKEGNPFPGEALSKTGDKVGRKEQQQMNRNNTNQAIRKSDEEIREEHLRSVKNHYKMLWVKLYRTALDIFLFYLAFIYFRYGRIFDLPEYGFRYNYFVTIARMEE